MILLRKYPTVMHIFSSSAHTEIREICLIPNACNDFTRRNHTNECSTGTWPDTERERWRGDVSWCCWSWCARWGFAASIRSHFTPPLAYVEICFGSKARRARQPPTKQADAGADKDMTNFTHLPRTKVDVGGGLTCAPFADFPKKFSKADNEVKIAIGQSTQRAPPERDERGAQDFNQSQPICRLNMYNMT